MHVSMFRVVRGGELCARGGCASPHLCMRESEVDVGSLSQSQTRGGFPHCTWARLAAEFRSRLPPFPSADSRCMQGCPDFYRGARDLNSGPRAYKAGTLPTEPSPQTDVYC